jgi:beta-lactamase regulating signal transducer with metallopeptidase domain
MPSGTDSTSTTSVVNPATLAADTAVFAGPTDEDVQRTGTVAATVPHAPGEAGNVWQAAAPFACIVYVFGVGIMLLRLLLAAGGTRRLRRSGRPIDDPRLLERLDSLARRVGLRVRPLVATSAKGAVPVVVGIMKPVIMLPGCVLSGLDPAQLEAILLHELAHIRRCDPLINLLQRCAETVLFFQPAVWIVSRRMRVLREDCCDDIVLQCEVPQSLYAESLVAVSELREGRTPGQTLAVAAVNPAERSLRRRVLRIPGESQGTGPLRVTRGGVLTLATLVVLSLSPVLLVLQGHATGQDGADSPHSEAIKKLIGNDPGESIYNDKLKRFKFRLEKVEVHTAETAKAFCSLYRDGEQATGRPKLIGAWGDPLTNSIVVIGPPEADQAIRETLAEWESGGVGVWRSGSLQWSASRAWMKHSK